MGQVSNTLPLFLKTDVGAAYVNTIGSLISVTNCNVAGSNSATAPSGTKFVRIQAWGGGGGGCGYWSGGIEYGGGGAGYNELWLPCAEGQGFNVTVGAGGTGGSSANGNSGGATYINNVFGDISIYATGGGAGRRGVAGTGSSSEGVAIPEDWFDSPWKMFDANCASGINGGSGSGGAAGGTAQGGGATVVSTVGANGNAPGGGGAPHNVSGGKGGNGGVGTVRFSWYGITSNTVFLRDYYNSGNVMAGKTIGKNGILPASGNINLTDLRAADHVTVGGSANDYVYAIADFDTQISPSTAFANAVARYWTYGYLNTQYTYRSHPLRLQLRRDDDSLLDHIQIRRVHTGGTHVASGAANNTWINANTSPEWYVEATRTTIGTNARTSFGNMNWRWTANSQVFANAQTNLSATATVEFDTCPTCCFTPETPITMADGSIRTIGEIQVGQLIRVFDHETRQFVSEAVKEIITVERKNVYKFTFADGRTLDATDDHPMYVRNKGYAALKPVDDYKDLGLAEIIAVGDFVVDENDNDNEIISIEEIYYPYTVYTFLNSKFYANGMLVY